MSANEIHVGDVGTLFKINVIDGAAIVSLTGTTSKQIVFKKPDATTYTGNLSFYTNGSDGIVTYLITQDCSTRKVHINFRWYIPMQPQHGIAI